MTTLTLRQLVARDHVPLPDDPALGDIPLAAATPHDFAQFAPHLELLFVGNPSLRITLVKHLAHILTARPDLSPALVSSSLWTRCIIRSMQLDTQPHLFAALLKLSAQVIPHAPAETCASVPVLGGVLVRAIVWRRRTQRRGIPRWGMTGVGADAARDMPENTVPGDTWDEGGFLNKAHRGSSGARMEFEDGVDRGNDDENDDGAVWRGEDPASGLAEVTAAPKPGLGWRAAAPTTNTTGMTTDTWAAPASIMSIDTASPATRAQDLPRALLLELYALWPANVIRLARDPATYLVEHAVESPYDVPWAEVWRKREVVDLLATALRGFLFNPAILLADAASEITDTLRFARTQTSESIAQGHALYLGNIMPSIDNAGGLLSSFAPGRGRQAEGNVPRDRMASPTDTALSSSGGSVQGRYHSDRKLAHHRSSAQQGGSGGGSGVGIGATTTAQATYISSQTAPINIRAMGIKGHHHHAGGETGTGGSAGETLQAEVDSLRREKEFLEIDLRHAKSLAGSYLQHVYRLHEKVIAVIADEAERQNIYNQLKEQTATIRHLREELRIQRAAADKAKESIAKMQTEQRETRQIQREEKRARALETSTTRAEIEDQSRILEAQKLELARVKEAHFKLNNRLREAEPKIKHIEDYEKEVDKLYHNQLLWDADIRKQKETESSLNKMTSAFKQMEIVLARHEKDKNSLQNQLSDQGNRMAQLQSEITRLTMQKDAPRDLPEEIASTIRQDAQMLQTKLQEARRRIDALEADKLELEARIEDLEYNAKTPASAQATLL
ncbi:hypothetical protein NliqN6_0564 [Naganishia liquefaciens]|uniref:Uncharacterized protein n=1 Tax=Naganishia liquefaciens TaxID=104408 RepID=A0A8H3YDC3_9TREE|nr:hypothetical protein NliqN6_0564 [Naganishia liquefaciens]